MRISRKGITGPANIAEFLKISEESVNKIVIPAIRNCTYVKVKSTLQRIDLVLSQKEPYSFGVEGIDVPGGGFLAYMYVNRGDAYSPTVIYDATNELFIISTWGDVIEKDKRFESKD